MMFKEKIEHIIENTRANLNISSDIIGHELINEMQLDDFVKNFINAEIEWWIYEDKILRNSNKSFNFNGLDSDLINNQINEIYRKNVRILKAELNELIGKSVKLRANYLIRPKSCLITFCFLNNIFISKEALSLKLEYFSDYEYLLDGLNIWLNNKSNDSQILRNDFEQQIFELEKEHIKSLDGNGFCLMIESLWDWFENDDNELYMEILKLFFDDKNMFDISKVINEYQQTNQKDFISKTELIELLSEIKPSQESEELAFNEEKHDESSIVIGDDSILQDIKDALALIAINNINTEDNNNSNEINNQVSDMNLSSDENSEEIVTPTKHEIESADISKILEQDDGTELSADDIDALFNS